MEPTVLNFFIREEYGIFLEQKKAADVSAALLKIISISFLE